jgi:MtN3 and saliva related transmembrane protein
MSTALAQCVSVLAPIVNCIQMFPQVYKTYRTKHVKDLSFYSIGLVLLTSILWLLHGYFIQDTSLIAAGVISVIVNVSLLYLFFKYK